ncbi:MAG: DUF2889 domain-containing protein [Candidatus Accumulibacter sp.]|jgi:hypothetical protein|nr:DUF2889 domain-containing protein [Accumulibacter sp.]
MPLPPVTATRARKHRRSLTFEGFRRDDGLWDIEGRLVDTKDQDIELRDGIRKRGEPIHDISVRVTIDRAMNVIDVAASADYTPFMGVCERILPDYRQIIGLNLFKGFLKAVKTMFGDTRGCAHVNELLMAVPTAAFQTFAGDVKPGEYESERKPFHLDHCHALSTDSEVVRQRYPRWYCPGDRGQKAEDR